MRLRADERTVLDDIADIAERGAFVGGHEVRELEEALADRAGVPHAVTCANGTDALYLSLRALGIGQGHAVVCPSFTFAATAEAIILAGAVPVFADVNPDTFNLEPSEIPASGDVAERNGLQIGGIVAVDMFGAPADYASILHFADRYGIPVIADAAQSFGAEGVGRLADITATSFYPTKPLGCWGDGGAVFTPSRSVANCVRMIANHGQSAKYRHNVAGINSRLDTIQAAVLLHKLRTFDAAQARRDRIARQYSSAFADVPGIVTPQHIPGRSWAQYTIQVGNRIAVMVALAGQGIEAAIHYPMPLHRQFAFKDMPRTADALSASEAASERVISLPLRSDLAEHVIATVRSAARPH